jgi:hypothetical protein
MKDCTIHFERFKAYHQKHSAWGNLHVVLDDQNLEDDTVSFCKRTALDENDIEGAELADLLLQMTKTQRGRISKEL